MLNKPLLVQSCLVVISLNGHLFENLCSVKPLVSLIQTMHIEYLSSCRNKWLDQAIDAWQTSLKLWAINCIVANWKLVLPPTRSNNSLKYLLSRCEHVTIPWYFKLFSHFHWSPYTKVTVWSVLHQFRQYICFFFSIRPTLSLSGYQCFYVVFRAATVAIFDHQDPERWKQYRNRNSEIMKF